MYKTVGWGEGVQTSRVGEDVRNSRVGEGVQTSRGGGCTKQVISSTKQMYQLFNSNSKFSNKTIFDRILISDSC